MSIPRCRFGPLTLSLLATAWVGCPGPSVGPSPDGGPAAGGDGGAPLVDAGVPDGGADAGEGDGGLDSGVVDSGVVDGYDGILAVDDAGRLVNGHGRPIQLRGANMSGLDNQSTGGYWDTDPWGSVGEIATGIGGPAWPVYASWKPNAVRIPLNAQSFLGVSMSVL